MNADLFVQIPEYSACAVYSREFHLLLIEKGWREIRPGDWAPPAGNDPDAAFVRLSMSITPRRNAMSMSGEAAPRQDLPTFQRRLDLGGEDVWAIG